VAATATSIGGTTFTMGFQLLLALVVIVLLIILFFGTRWGFTAYKKWKNFKITAVVFNPDGTWYTRKIGKFRTKDNIDKMLFLGSTDTMPVIDPKYIRANRVTLWRYGVGQYAVLPPRMWEQMDPKNFKIEVINFQMKNFAFLEQRAAVSRWAYVKDALLKWAPFIVIGVVAIACGVMVWFMMKLGMDFFNQVVGQRIAECKSVLGTAITPTG
jgi:hypothetical protein